MTGQLERISVHLGDYHALLVHEENRVRGQMALTHGATRMKLAARLLALEKCRAQLEATMAESGLLALDA